MADWKVVGDSAEVSPVSDTDPGEPRSDKTLDRRHVNVLLAFSEEELMKDLEPHEYHCYKGWEEAVCGWARVAPLASILLAEKKGHKPKRRDADHDSSTSAQSECFTALSTEAHFRPPTRNFRIPSQHMWMSTKTDTSNTTPEIPEMLVIEDVSKTISQLNLEDQIRDTRTPFQINQVTPKCNLADNRLPKSRKNSQRANNAVVPIKNFNFLPPIKMEHNQHQNLPGNKTQLCETGMDSFFIIEKINCIRRTKGELVYTELPKDPYNEAISSKFRTCHHNPNYYSTMNMSDPNRYHVTVSSKPETLHPAGYSVSKTLRTGTASRPVHMQSSYLYS